MNPGPDASAGRDGGPSDRGPDGGRSAEAGTGPDTPPAACEGLVCDPLMPFPKTIKETGFFPAPPDFTKFSPRLKPFTPAYELFSDGLHKLRYILLPEGQKIDNTDPAKWVFPIGTIMVKTFLDDAGGIRHPVETRLIRRKDRFAYDSAVYKWNAAGTEAELAANSGMNRVPVPATLTGRGMWMHNIPSEQDCEDCHEANRKATGASFIGFDEIRLNSKVPATAMKTQLEEFRDLGFFTGALPAAPAAIVDPNANLQRVKRFIFANCAHCHHGDGTFDMRPNVFVANTVGKMTEASGVMAPAGYLRVVRKNPERSVVFLQARGTGLNAIDPSLRVMPPIGVRFPPGFPMEELTALQAWINSL